MNDKANVDRLLEYRISGRKGYVHDGLRVEVFAKKSDSYQELLKRGCEALNLKPASGKYLSLFKPLGIQLAR